MDTYFCTSTPLPAVASDTLPLLRDVEEEANGLAAGEGSLPADGTVDSTDTALTATAAGDSFAPAGVGVDASMDAS